MGEPRVDMNKSAGPEYHDTTTSVKQRLHGAAELTTEDTGGQ